MRSNLPSPRKPTRTISDDPRAGQYHVVGAVRDLDKMEAVAEVGETRARHLYSTLQARAQEAGTSWWFWVSYFRVHHHKTAGRVRLGQFYGDALRAKLLRISAAILQGAGRVQAHQAHRSPHLQRGRVPGEHESTRQPEYNNTLSFRLVQRQNVWLLFAPIGCYSNVPLPPPCK